MALIALIAVLLLLAVAAHEGRKKLRLPRYRARRRSHRVHRIQTRSSLDQTPLSSRASTSIRFAMRPGLALAVWLQERSRGNIIRVFTGEVTYSASCLPSRAASNREVRACISRETSFRC